MNIVAIIPARMGSSRFPGKPMEKICGIPMIGHVYLRTRMCKKLNSTYVATCDREIFEYIESIGGQAIMTKDTHEHCSDRCTEAMLILEKETKQQIDVVVMVQGDEPLVTPGMIEKAIAPFGDDPDVNVVNLMAPIKTLETFEDPNEVKVVIGLDGNALYFSREPIPSMKKGARDVPMLKQVCIIPFRRDYLLKFGSMPESPMEKIESVDMLRVLENGDKVKMVMSNEDTLGVDTPDDLRRAVGMMASDSLFADYKQPVGD